MKDSKKDFIAAVLAIIIILLVILIVLVSYGILSSKNEKVNIYEEEKSIEVFEKIDDGKEKVYDEKINYTLNFDSVKFEINSIMPVINIKSDKVKLINDEIKKL